MNRDTPKPQPGDRLVAIVGVIVVVLGLAVASFLVLEPLI
jgi:hypothetical protein